MSAVRGGRSHSNAASPAVVVGLCAHGLACVRSLSREGIKVYGLEERVSLAGCWTRHATIIEVEDINGPGLVKELRRLWDESRFEGVPVLFLTNDNMVRNVASHWAEIDGMYNLCWSGQRDLVAQLLQKSEIEQHARSRNLLYPRTMKVSDENEAVRACKVVGQFPLIAKPSRPLSGYKARRVKSSAELVDLCRKFCDDLPFLVQGYVPGGDTEIYFVALYLVDGVEIAKFTGRKIMSHPPAMGQTTAAEAADCADLVEVAREFFRDTGITGPVSLELKRDRDGVAWIIEPTVGRTDYWLDCCIANGVNIPVIQYGERLGFGKAASQQVDRRIWMDAERDPRILLHVTRKVGIRGWIGRGPRFTYWDWMDPVPGVVAVAKLGKTRMRRWLSSIRNSIWER